MNIPVLPTYTMQAPPILSLLPSTTTITTITLYIVALRSFKGLGMGLALKLTGFSLVLEWSLVCL